MRLWIDDIRPAPEGYIWKQNVASGWATIILAHSRMEKLIIDLDYDAGEYAEKHGDYIELLNLLEEKSNTNKFWEEYLKEYVSFHIHSMNTVGAENMRRIIRRSGWKEV